MNALCKTCKHWTKPANGDGFNAQDLCDPVDDDNKPMQMPFEVRLCKHPTQTFCERPVESNGFALADASTYYAVLATAENFGCVRWESK